MRKLPQLVPISYRDADNGISLKCYADTIVYLRENNKRILTAVRFGGYPEQVRGMSDAINGGISVETEIEQNRVVIYSERKRYRKKLSHDGVYAESMMIMLDDEKNNVSEGEQNGKENIKQRKYIFCRQNDRQALFDEIDQKISVPLIPEFKDFIIDAFIERRILIPLEVLSIEQNFDACMLYMRNDEQDVIDIVNQGLAQGKISIPSADLSKNNFKNNLPQQQWTRRDLQLFCERYMQEFTQGTSVSLTYHPIYIIAKKKKV